MFLPLEYSIKLPFIRDHFTENHGAFEKKTHQQNCFRKLQFFRRPRERNAIKWVEVMSRCGLFSKVVIVMEM